MSLPQVDPRRVIDRSDLVVGLKHPVFICSSRPRDLDGARDAAWPLSLFLWQVRWGEQFAAELRRGPDV